MPFTLAHPAAAIPLSPVLGRYGLLSGLVIGSLAPDFPYLFLLPLSRLQTHSLTGLFWFSFPAGMVALYAYHLVLHRPLVFVAPAAVRARTPSPPSGRTLARRIPFPAAVISVLLGAATHLLWDTFTHASSPLVQNSTFLQRHLATWGGMRLEMFNLLQHSGTAAGLLLLAFLSYRWTSRAPVLVDSPPESVGAGWRWPLRALIVLIPLGWAGLHAWVPLSEELSVLTVSIAAGRAGFAALPALGWSVLLASGVWHLANRVDWCPESEVRRN